MSIIYLATIGQRPQAVTVAFDALREKHNFDYAQIGLLHTDPVRSGIAAPLRDLVAEIRRAYPEIQLEQREIRALNDAPLLDIEDDASAEAYFYGVLDALLAYKKAGYAVHLMVAGGRKAMSVYAVYAASLLMDEYDAVFTVLTPKDIMDAQVYHVGGTDRARIQVTRMPFLPSRFAPTTLETLTRQDIIDYLAQRVNRKEMLFSRLTRAQRQVVNLLASHEDYTDDQIANLLSIAPKTVENHLREVYDRMRATFDFGDRIQNPRLALIKIMKGWE